MAIITKLNRFPEKAPEKAFVSKKQVTRRTAVLLVLCGIAAFAALIAQLAKIMIREHDYYESAAVENQVRSTVVTASRGTIYDTQGKILAQSATVETVYISPFEMVRYGEDKEAIAAALSRILDVDYDSIMKKWEDTDSWYKTVRTKVEQDLADQVRDYVNGGFLSDPNYRQRSDEVVKRGYLCSVHLIEDTKRYYPYSTLGSQLIGFVGTDNYGLDGIEAMYNSTLEGENGRIVRKVIGVAKLPDSRIGEISRNKRIGRRRRIVGLLRYANEEWKNDNG